MVRLRVERVWPLRLRRLQNSAVPVHGLTLLEILIVLVLILAAAAIAIPAMTQRFESTRFDATVDQIVATLALARAESQRARRPVQIMWEPTDRIVYAAWLDTALLGGDEPDEPSPSAGDSANSMGVNANDDARSTSDRLDAAAEAGTRAMATGGSRLRITLPEGCRVSTRATSEAETSPDPAGGSSDPADQSRGLADAEPLSLIVYMPDGSTFGEASFTVVDKGGRQSRVEVNPWTGQASVSRSLAPAPTTSSNPASDQLGTRPSDEAQP